MQRVLFNAERVTFANPVPVSEVLKDGGVGLMFTLPEGALVEIDADKRILSLCLKMLLNNSLVCYNSPN